MGESVNFITKNKKHHTEEEIKHLYKMYLNVWSKNKDLNIFALPFSFFQEICTHKDWEIIEIYPKDTKSNLSCGVLFIHISDKSISPLIFGASSKTEKDSNMYRFVLNTILQQSFSENIDDVFLGITNSSEKRKIGAKQYKTKAYFQVSDHFNDNVIETYSKQVNLVEI